MKILVINAGSSSLKYQFIDMDNMDVIAKGLCERIGIDGRLKHTPAGKDTVIIEKAMPDHTAAIGMVIDALTDKDHGVISGMDEISAVGHRVVHGGELFSESVVIDEGVKKSIEECIELAPLHNPANLTGILACENVIPHAKQVAVFDTAFHQTMPSEAYLYALPYEYYTKHKIRRYGFHGTSHKYVTGRAAELLGKPVEELKLITLHLGNGSSLAAVNGGKSVDTSMGFTPLAGLVMGTRSGDIDPAIVSYVAEKENLSVKEVSDVLNKKSGVLGVSGVSSDFRDLAEQAETNDRAKLSLDMFSYSLKKFIGQYIAVMNGVDALVFTAGIGENNVELRSQIAKELSFFGLSIDEEKNKVRGKDMDISTPDAKVKTLVIPTNEELMIALDTKRLVENL
ncbi:MAG: acetate kinase [Ruminococcaceae bacterium]|nr:acetate kinase [Oscillospiraceae bacterium]